MGVSSALGSSALLPAGLGFRNVLINGGFDVWQRGTGSIAPGNGVITNADRWVHTGNTTTFTQQTDVPAGFRYSLGVSGSDPSFAQKIEAANSARLASQTVTFSIWAKSVSGSTSLFVNFYYPSAVDNFASLTTISSTTIATTVSSSWTRYTLTVALPANVTNGLQVLVGRSAGASNTYFTGVQLEQNLQPTPFEQRPIGTELELCQRYYETSYDLGTAPTTVTEVGALYSGCSNANALDGGSVRFKVNKRAIPSIRTFGTSNGDWNKVTEFTENPRTLITPRAIAHMFIGTTGYVINGNQQLASGRFYAFHYEASAEL